MSFTPCVPSNSLTNVPAPATTEAIMAAHHAAIASRHAAHATQDKINNVICGLIGKLYKFDYEKDGVDQYGHSLAPYNFLQSEEQQLNCIFHLKKDVESVDTKNWGANVKNKDGRWLSDEATYTVKQLSDVGLYTFDCPEQMKIKVQLFCNGHGDKSKSCNKNMRMMKECEGRSLSECMGWTLQEALNWAAEQARMNPDDYGYSIQTSAGPLEIEDAKVPVDAQTILDKIAPKISVTAIGTILENSTSTRSPI